MKRKIATKKEQLGQTLIETLVAIFILITGMISAITLAIYSYQTSDTTSKQVIATALAREGQEAVKNIRDGYWLDKTNDPLVDCADLGGGQKCHQNWQGSGAQKLSQGDFVVDFSSSGGVNSWVINKTPSNYKLYYEPAIQQYHNAQTGTSSVLSAYSRKVNIVEQTSSPYTVANPRLLVTVSVWWTGRTCPATSDPTTLPANCKIVLQNYLTNWRNY